MAAAYGDHVKAMRPLLDATAADATAADAKGWTPLHWAAVGRPEAGLHINHIKRGRAIAERGGVNRRQSVQEFSRNQAARCRTPFIVRNL